MRLAGRDDVLLRLTGFLDAPEPGSRGLLIQGEAGIGKTAVWRAALDRVRAANHHVLVARPAEEERQSSLLGLRDLFEDLEPEALLLEPDADVFDRGRAVLRLLRRLCDERTVVLAIDDVQWLDPISARALRFALRRLEDRPVWLIATLRSHDATVPLELLPPDRTLLLTLGALPIEAIRQVLAAVVASIPRPALEQIQRLSGGNPMYALELARLAGLGDPGAPLAARRPVRASD